MSTSPDEETNQKRAHVYMDIPTNQHIAAVVIITKAADTPEWSAGIKRPEENRVGYAWIAEKLRSFSTELELQDILEGDGDTSTGDGQPGPDGH